MPQLGPLEILVVLVVALMVFGPKRLPEVGRQVGHGLRELRKIQETVRAEIHDVLNAPDTPSPAGRSDSGPSEGTPMTYRTSGTTAAPTGRPAPSRFRPALGPAAEPAKSDVPAKPDDTASGTAAVPERGRGTRAPSRFRAPGA